MVNHTTGAQRYNTRLHKIFAESKILKAKYEKEDRDKILSIIIEAKEGISTEDLIKKMDKSEDYIKNIILKLLQDGFIFEPKPSILQYL